VKTDSLIAALVADRAAIGTPIAYRVTLAMACGLALSAAFFFWQLGWRPDIGEVRGTLPFLFKFVVTAALLVPAAILVARLARPDAAPGLWGWALLIAPLLLVAGSSADLIASPTNVWTAKLIGANAAACVTLILLLSIAPLAAVLFALSEGAPAEPGLTGAVAGLVAGALAATLYAMHCTDDSPLFVATWYTIAIGIMALAGSVLGVRLLRW
jgi:hypothetical protein